MGSVTYVCLYVSYLEALSPFTDEEKGRLMTAMIKYAVTGEEPEFNGNERYIWPSIKAQIDRDIQYYQEKCATNRINGRKGGRPSKNREVIPETERFSEKPKKPKEKDKENENGKEKDMDKEKESESIIADKPPHTWFTPPTLDEVEAYCTEKCYNIDPQRFVDYYTSNGWKIGRNHMEDWRAAVRSWNGKEKPDGKNEHKPAWTVGTVV